MPFYGKINSFSYIFYPNRKILHCLKENKKNFVKKNRKFVDSGIGKTCVELDLNEMRRFQHCDVQSQ